MILILIGMSLFFIPGVFSLEGNRKMGILLVPVGKVEQRILERLRNGLPKVFNQEVSIGKELPVPEDAYHKKRNQYLSTKILRTLMEQKEFTPYEKVLGVVDRDLYVPELNFVFGEASERVAVISLTRLRQEFYHLPEDPPLFEKRALTEAVHELGHTYGLGHCRDSHCVMFFSNSLRDTDRKGVDFCRRCKSKLPFLR